MDRILIILKKENGPRASSAPALGLNTIIFKHVYWYMYMQQTQVSVYRTIGPLVLVTINVYPDLIKANQPYQLGAGAGEGEGLKSKNVLLASVLEV